MKNLYQIIFSCLLLITPGFSQCDYSISKYMFGSDKNVFYGIATDYQGNPDSLFMDIYYPIGTIEKKRPLFVLAFGGGFFQGTRQDLTSICTEFAARGIICATIDYRLGFDGPAGLNPPFAFDAAEVLRAGFRGTTDMKGAIRFLKAKHHEYDIDLERVWTGGFSAGAMVAINAAFLNKESEKPKEAGNINPIAAKKRPDLGPIDGTLNLNGYDASVQGVFNFYGALLDTLAVDASDRVAVFSYHQTNDPIVPCNANTPYHQISFIAVNYPIVYGTCVITDRFRNLGIDPMYWESWIYSGNQHASHNDVAVMNFMMDNAKPILCKNSTGISESYSLFDKTYISPNPATQHLQIMNLSGDFHYSIFDISGYKIDVPFLNSNQILDIHHLNNGMYFILIRSNGESKVYKFLKS